MTSFRQVGAETRMAHHGKRKTPCATKGSSAPREVDGGRAKPDWTDIQAERAGACRGDARAAGQRQSFLMLLLQTEFLDQRYEARIRTERVYAGIAL